MTHHLYRFADAAMLWLWNEFGLTRKWALIGLTAAQLVRPVVEWDGWSSALCVAGALIWGGVEILRGMALSADRLNSHMIAVRTAALPGKFMMWIGVGFALFNLPMLNWLITASDIVWIAMVMVTYALIPTGPREPKWQRNVVPA